MLWPSYHVWGGGAADLRGSENDQIKRESVLSIYYQDSTEFSDLV